MGQARARVSQCSPVFYLYRTFSFPASSSLRHFPLSSRASSVEPRSCNWRVVVLQCGCCLMKVAGRCSGPVHLHRWPSRGPLCPVCNSENISFAEENECDRLFVKVVVHAKNTRTIFLPRNTSAVLSLVCPENSHTAWTQTSKSTHMSSSVSRLACSQRVR